MKRFLLPLVLVLTGCNEIPASKTKREFKKPVLRYLNDVLIKKEFGAGDGSVVRWIESPEVIMMEGKEEHQKIARLGNFSGFSVNSYRQLRMFLLGKVWWLHIHGHRRSN